MAVQKTAKKVLFAWEGTDKQGKKIKGQMNAANIDFVKANLRKQGIVPKKVKKGSSGIGGTSKKKITTGDIAVFSRQLATMMKAGVPLVQSFEITGSGHSNPAMRDLIFAIKSDVEAGGTFASAIRQHPIYFDDLFCNLVEAGEASGALETLLEKIATYKEKTEQLKIKIKKALTYPIIVMIFAVVVTAILLIWVVPVFAEMFQGFGADLPAFTQFVVDISDAVVDTWYLIAGVIIAVIAAFNQAYMRSPALRNNIDKGLLKAPVISGLVQNSAIARFARTLSTMFAAGVPLVEAMDSVAGAAGNSVYKNAILTVRDDIAAGQQLQASLAQFPQLYPNMVIQMIAIGEESGALDEMLSKVADYFEEQVDVAVDNLTAMLEPAIMAFLAVVVGGLVIAMYLPLFQMGSVVGG